MDQTNPTPRTWTDAVRDKKDEIKGAMREKMAGATDATKGLIAQRVEQYQPQIEMLGTAYCTTQRTDLYYGAFALGFGAAVALGTLVVVVARLVRRPTKGPKISEVGTSF